MELEIDLESQSVILPDKSSFKFEIDPFAKNCLLANVDQLGYILSFVDKIKDYEESNKSITIN